MLKHLLILGLLFQVGSFSVAYGEPVFERPQCPESQITSGLCFNRDMPRAVQIQAGPELQKAFEAVVAAAEARLNAITPDKRKVVLTDLDETLVSNLGYYRRQAAPSVEAWRHWVHHCANGPYNAKVLALLKHAKARGFSIMFITGRPPSQAKDTLRQVSGLQWDGMFFRTDHPGVGSTAFKAATRKLLREQGYEIVVNIGDQPSDMDLPVNPEEGEFLLPNVLYHIP